MGKVRRGGYVFLSWKGDHDPGHVHVFKAGRLIVKWDLENWRAMKGRPTRRLLEIIESLQAEKLI